MKKCEASVIFIDWDRQDRRISDEDKLVCDSEWRVGKVAPESTLVALESC